MKNVPRPVELTEAVSWESPNYADTTWPARDPRSTHDGSRHGIRLLTGAHWEITGVADQALSRGHPPPAFFNRLPIMTSLDVSGDPGGPSDAVRYEICSYPVSPFAGWTELEIQQWVRQHHLHAAAEPIAHFLARSRLKRAIDDRVSTTTM